MNAYEAPSEASLNVALVSLLASAVMLGIVIGVALVAL